jgi:hypothetical protein
MCCQVRPERRAWPRNAVRYRVLVLPEDCALEEPYGAWVTDTSRDGLHLCMQREAIAAGTLVWVRTPNAASWLAVRVKHCRLHAGEWQLGCELVAAQPVGQRAG